MGLRESQTQSYRDQLFVDATAEMLSFLRQLREALSHELRRAMIRVVGNAAPRRVLGEPRPDAIGKLAW